MGVCFSKKRRKINSIQKKYNENIPKSSKMCVINPIKTIIDNLFEEKLIDQKIIYIENYLFDPKLNQQFKKVTKFFNYLEKIGQYTILELNEILENCCIYTVLNSNNEEFILFQYKFYSSNDLDSICQNLGIILNKKLNCYTKYIGFIHILIKITRIHYSLIYV